MVLQAGFVQSHCHRKERPSVALEALSLLVSGLLCWTRSCWSWVFGDSSTEATQPVCSCCEWTVWLCCLQLCTFFFFFFTFCQCAASLFLRCLLVVMFISIEMMASLCWNWENIQDYYSRPLQMGCFQSAPQFCLAEFICSKVVWQDTEGPGRLWTPHFRVTRHAL